MNTIAAIEVAAGCRKLTKHSIESLTSPIESENGSDGGSTSPKKENKDRNKVHSDKVTSYTEMIARAILASPNVMATLADIYSHLISKYPLLKGRGKSWKNSVRHTLSLNEWFIKIPKLDNAKCCYWSIHPSYLQRFRKGDFQKQRKAAITKLRTHHHNSGHHHNRYYDLNYDISPTMDYHFPTHFNEMNNTSVSPHANFSSWPSRSPYEEYQTFFPPSGTAQQYQSPYQPTQMYNQQGTPPPYPVHPATNYPHSYYGAPEHENFFNYRPAETNNYYNAPPSHMRCGINRTVDPYRPTEREPASVLDNQQSNPHQPINSEMKAESTGC
ncbi:forkhead box protein B2-like [Clytia hemisphaerica]|uniref:Fork-head domain-containing protein n=1 Tax=Clytia hemisphaerica TaxID=252671 RepID=A0A7M5WL97_9CNID